MGKDTDKNGQGQGQAQGRGHGQGHGQERGRASDRATEQMGFMRTTGTVEIEIKKYVAVGDLICGGVFSKSWCDCSVDTVKD